MLESPVIEVAISLALVYLVLSLLCSVASEWISQILRLRSRTLRKGIERLLLDDRIRKEFLRHPFINGLGAKPSRLRSMRLLSPVFNLRLFSYIFPPPFPSYIRSQTFARALLDFVPPVDKDSRRDDERPVLLGLSHSGYRNLDETSADIEASFDVMMERVSGWYKRKVQWILLGLGFAAALAINADTIALTKGLWNNTTLRQVMVAAAVNYVTPESLLKKSQNTDQTKLEEEDQTKLEEVLIQIALPLGWTARPVGWGWLWKIVGLLLTAIAVSLGAPFWFDVVGRFVRLRGTGQVPQSAGGGEQRAQAGNP